MSLRSRTTPLLTAILILLASGLRADDTHAVEDELALAAAQLTADAAVAAPLVEAAAIDPADCAGNGSWSSVINWTPHIPVSVANLPDGRLLSFASNQRTCFPVGARVHVCGHLESCDRGVSRDQSHLARHVLWRDRTACGWPCDGKWRTQ